MTSLLGNPHHPSIHPKGIPLFSLGNLTHTQPTLDPYQSQGQALARAGPSPESGKRDGGKRKDVMATLTQAHKEAHNFLSPILTCRACLP